jgi:hypothetical protein
MPTREVHRGDAIPWLEQIQLGPEHAVVTSLPDASELAELGFEGWRRWFVETASLVCERVHDDAVAIFYQTDIKHDGRWIDKAHLIQLGAERAGAHCLWHKIVCRKEPGTTTFGRPAYGHWLAVSRGLRLSPAAMPMTAAVASCTFLQRHTSCRVVVDPFCGRGTVLAVANLHGLDAIGVEISNKRAKKARGLVVAATSE